MVDTSASQAGRPLAQARSILAAFAREAAADDRLDVWTININHPSATAPDRRLPAGRIRGDPKAIAQLENAEYGSGAVDLKAGLEQAAKQFEARNGRSPIMLYLGDGEKCCQHRPADRDAPHSDTGWRRSRSPSSLFRSDWTSTRRTCTA